MAMKPVDFAKFTKDQGKKHRVALPRLDGDMGASTFKLWTAISIQVPIGFSPALRKVFVSRQSLAAQ